MRRSNVRDLVPADIAAMTRDQIEDAVSQRARTVYLGNGRVLTRVLGRYKMYFDTDDRGFAANLMLDGYWEIWLTQFMARHVKPGMTAIDIGANYGYYTMLLGDIVGAAGKVVAIEPNPRAVAALCDNVLLNGLSAQVDVLSAAVGATERDRVELYVPRGEPKAATVVREFVGDEIETVAVRQTTLDALADRYRAIDFIKINAEGAELAIVEGGQRLLAARRPALVLEFNLPRYPDPAGFLRRLIQIYGGMQSVTFDGTAEPVTSETVLSTRGGEDWLLYFAAP